jgi:hypothetical protein
VSDAQQFCWEFRGGEQPKLVVQAGIGALAIQNPTYENLVDFCKFLI